MSCFVNGIGIIMFKIFSKKKYVIIEKERNVFKTKE